MPRSKESIEQRKKHVVELRTFRINNGLCTWCGVKAEEIKTMCSKHLKKASETATKYAKSRGGKESKRRWRSDVGRFSAVSSLSRRQGKEWSLNENSWRSIISMPCFYCGLENDSGSGSGMDRLDNSKGYVEGNVVSCCYECNTARNNNFSPEEMKIIGSAIRAVKLAREGK